MVQKILHMKFMCGTFSCEDMHILTWFMTVKQKDTTIILNKEIYYLLKSKVMITNKTTY